MLYVDGDKCAGCGVCEETCPAGAIALVGGVATIDQARCTECEACLEACPNGAILMVTEPVPAERKAPEIIPVEAKPVPVPLPARAIPVVGAALAFLGREIAPRLAAYLVDALDRRLSQRQAGPAARASGSASLASGVGGRGLRRRRRRGRGGR